LSGKAKKQQNKVHAIHTPGSLASKNYCGSAFCHEKAKKSKPTSQIQIPENESDTGKAANNAPLHSSPSFLHLFNSVKNI
jgi:hypothetical protein